MMQDVNPLEVLSKRVLNFMPKHFVRTSVGEVYANPYGNGINNTHQWIRQNLKGRFCIVDQPVIDSNSGRLKHKKFVGFEDPKELTYFMLACPYK